MGNHLEEAPTFEYLDGEPREQQMIELRAREGTRGEAEDEAEEARGEADAQSDVFVMYVH